MPVAAARQTPAHDRGATMVFMMRRGQPHLVQEAVRRPCRRHKGIGVAAEQLVATTIQQHENADWEPHDVHGAAQQRVDGVSGECSAHGHIFNRSTTQGAEQYPAHHNQQLMVSHGSDTVTVGEASYPVHSLV